jgi:uncharacterized protein YggE
MKMQAVSLVLFALMICGRACADSPKNQIEVRAVGTVTVPADTIVLEISIATNSSDLQEAKKHNDQLTTPIYQLAEARHVARPTLLATRLSFDFVPPQSTPNQGEVPQVNAKQQQEYIPQGNQRFIGEKGGKDYVPGPPEPPIHLSRNLEVKFKSFTEAIGFASEMVKWGPVCKSREISLAPLSFGVADREKCLVDARRRAVVSARQKAQLLAEANALKLGNATLIYDESSDLVREAGTAIPGFPILPSSDPFSASQRREGRGNASLVRLVAMQREVAEKFDLDQIPPARLTVTASVRIVFEVKP